MRTHAEQSSSAEFGRRVPQWAAPQPARVPQFTEVLADGTRVLQRQALCACGGGCPTCQIQPSPQTKLAVSSPGDRYEQEADRVAEQVMRSDSTQPVGGARQDALQRKAGAEPDSAGAAAHDSYVRELGPGRPLDAETRAFMEPRFGRDFGHVRVHADERAAASARAVNARAYTVGRDIVFGAGQYAPGAAAGRQLLAHELTHTVQQAAGAAPAIQRQIEVPEGLKLDTHGFTTTRTGDIYTCPAVVRNSVWNEIFTSLLHSPRIFTLAGTTNAEINANFLKHMKSRYNIVEFASRKKYTFAAGSDFRMNPEYWIVDATGWRLKPGADPKTAIRDLNVNPEKYAIACQAATMLTMEGGGESPLTQDDGVAEDDWIPGDWGYIRNDNFASGAKVPGTEGENIIYTGKNKFWGHFGPGNEYKTLQEWFEQVKSWDGAAFIKTHRRRPNIGLDE